MKQARTLTDKEFKRALTAAAQHKTADRDRLNSAALPQSLIKTNQPSTKPNKRVSAARMTMSS